MIFEMAEYSSKNSDDYKREIDKLTSTTNKIISLLLLKRLILMKKTLKNQKFKEEKSESIKIKISRIIPELVEETKSEGKEKGSSCGIKINNFRVICFDWIDYPCIFDICSSCRRTFSNNSRYYIYCCINRVIYFDRNNC